jgi:hypothetical protein
VPRDRDWPGHVLSISTVLDNTGWIVHKYWKARNGLFQRASRCRPAAVGMIVALRRQPPAVALRATTTGQQKDGDVGRPGWPECCCLHEQPALASAAKVCAQGTRRCGQCRARASRQAKGHRRAAETAKAQQALDTIVRRAAAPSYVFSILRPIAPTGPKILMVAGRRRSECSTSGVGMAMVPCPPSAWRRRPQQVNACPLRLELRN